MSPPSPGIVCSVCAEMAGMRGPWQHEGIFDALVEKFRLRDYWTPQT